MKNKIYYIIGGAVLVLLVLAIVGKKAGWFGKEKGLRVNCIKAEKRTLVESVSANGRIQPEKEVKISSDVSGEIMELYVKEGDSVFVGKLLAKIDPELYLSSLDRSEASLNNTKANLASTRARLLQAQAKFNEIENAFKRNEKMRAQQLISEAEFESAKSAYENAKAEVEAGKQNIIAAEFSVKSFNAALNEAKKNLSRTNIYSPVNGIVSKLSVEKGERVVGTSQMAGTEMMRVANLNQMQVNVDVNENDIVKVGIGDTVKIDVDAYPGRKFTGLVREVANSATTNAATTSDQVTNFIVKISILNSSYADLKAQFGKRKSVFRPGMSASVEIETSKIQDAWSVPIEAVTVRNIKDIDSIETDGPDKEIEVVFINSNNEASIKKVKTGIQDDKFIQIINGIDSSDEIVAGPYNVVSKLLKKGDKIQKVSKEELFENKE
jgi:HlyD family secretion protein